MGCFYLSLEELPDGLSKGDSLFYIPTSKE